MIRPETLGQLLLMQSYVTSLPDEKSIFSFVCRGLQDIPGVAGVRYVETIQEQINESIVRFPLLLGETCRGELLVTVVDSESFTPYADYLKNFCFMLAVILEERNQRKQNELFQAELESRVQQRTSQLQIEINERIAVEESLRESEERYRNISIQLTKTVQELQESNSFNQSIIDSSTDCIKLLDLKGRLQYMSPGGQIKLGIKNMDEFLNISYEDFWKGENRDAALEAISKAQHGHQGSFEGYCPTLDGTPKWWEVIITPVKGSDGNPEKLLAVSRDISNRKSMENELHIQTMMLEEELAERQMAQEALQDQAVILEEEIEEHRRAEEALKKSERRLNEAERIGSSGSWDYDVATDKAAWSENMFKIFDVDPSMPYELVFEHIVKNRVHPDDYPCFETVLKEALENGVPYKEELRINRPDGIEKTIIIICEPLCDSTGKVVKLRGLIQDITERKLIEETLIGQQSEVDIIRKILDADPGFVFVKDSNLNYLTANHSFCDLLRIPYDQIYGKTDYDIFPADLAEKYIADDKRVMETGRPIVVEEVTWNSNDNSRFVVQTRKLPWFDKDGKVCGLYGMGFDMSELRAAESHLLESRKQYQILVEGTPDLITRVDREGRFVFVNHAALNIYGLSPEECIGRLAFDFIHPEDRESTIKAFHHWVNSGMESFSIENRQVSISGKVNFMAWSIRSEKNENGIVQGFASTARDITERKQIEEALRIIENRQAKMIASISDVIVIIDQFGINRFKSPNVEKWFGWKPEELVGASAWDNVHPDDLVSAQKFVGALAKEPGAIGTIECRYRCKDSSYKWIEITLNNLLDDPDICGILGDYHDISDRKQAEDEKITLESQLHQAQRMESIGSLAGGIAHDFNNKLSVILGYAEMAQIVAGPEAKIQNHLKEIYKAAESSADLTRQLLAFSRQQTIVPKVLNLNETITSMLNMLNRLIGENFILDWQTKSDLWPINFDPSQIDQILANLCVNARDAMSGNGKIAIETSNSTVDESYVTQHPDAEAGDYVKIKVSDNGCGMDKKTIDRIFEPFFTTKELGKGTGLGLATVFGIVKQNNGFINVFSEPGNGTTFTIYLPRYTGNTKQILPEEPALSLPRGQEIILLVEDELQILEMATMILTTQGYTVLPANSVKEALRLGQEHSGGINLLISDVIMPEMNGKELTNSLKSLNPELKSIFMSGYTADVISQHGVLDKGVNFIQKPFSLPDLAHKVRDVLDSK